MAIIQQNQTETANQFSADITLENVKVSDYNKKGLYFTNVKNLTLKNCTFENCAGSEMDDPNTYGDYVVDLNLCGVKDTVVNIENCTFNDNKAKKSNIKIAARGGESDEAASDIPKNVGEATVKSVSISGCTFTATPEDVQDFTIGTDSKTEGKEDVNTSGAYAVTITNNTTETKVLQKYNNYSVVVPAANTTYTKQASTDLQQQ